MTVFLIVLTMFAPVLPLIGEMIQDARNERQEKKNK